MIETDRAPTSSISTPRASRVLVVDDHEAVRRGLTRYLQIHGFEVTEAPDGASALQALEGNEPFPILLTDLRLPDIEGIEVIQRARKIDPLGWIGLITGWDIDPEEAEGYGVNAILLKPVDNAELVARLRAL
jgi:DNA-binding response OmpR family regulator